MPAPTDVPSLKEFSPSMRVDLLISDWKAAVDPKLSDEERERRLYGQAWDAYRDGDYGFGLWCWHECDRLTNNLNGNIREVTRILGPGHYFGFSHRRAVAEAVPADRIYRPRKGDMSTPRTDAFVLPHYQVLCVYLVRASSGDPKAKATLEIALGELEDQRRADPFLKHFETFRDLLVRTSANAPPPNSVAAASSPAAMPNEDALRRRPPTRRHS
ncbi:MAG TPA: hypothetical protein VJ021_04015 [Thermoplasmata archaeon]|nr:hypothetical protein [Thermoplasmata archaeon]